jgi:hypothetical protein
LFTQEPINQYIVEDTIAIDVDLFGENDPASITLIYDVKDFLKNKNKDKYVKAQLIYHLNDTIDINKEIRLKARGKNRKEVCPFPPLWINIRKANLQNSYLEGVKKIKLVTYCARGRSNLDYVLKEFLVYKMYNLVSPYSFRVRLVKVKYVDIGRKNREYDSWGFFIEPEDMMAQRLNAFPLKLDNIGYRSTDPWETDIMSTFQYIIGNADYSIRSRQNVKLLILDDTVKVNSIPVPYDFDYSGFVNADYAIPGDNLGITSVTQRYFLGPCRTEETYRQIFDHFFKKQEEIYHLLKSFEYLDERVINVAIKYLDEFFLSARDEKYISRNLWPTCRDTTVNRNK